MVTSSLQISSRLFEEQSTYCNQVYDAPMCAPKVYPRISKSAAPKLKPLLLTNAQARGIPVEHESRDAYHHSTGWCCGLIDKEECNET